MLQIETPAVLVDLDKLEINLNDMASFSSKQGIALRPHIKAHKTPEIALKQLESGASGITVATLKEAEVMLDAGIRDIFIAYQVTGQDKLNRLKKLITEADLSAAVDSLEGAWFLASAARAAGEELPVLLEINTGLNRCGVLPGAQALQLARSVSEFPDLYLKGIFTHAGQVYGAASEAEVAEIGRHEGQATVDTAQLLKREGFPLEVVSVGSTPTAKIAGQVEGITEIRPGNYVFYDAIQVGLGVVSLEKCALRVRAGVISKPAEGRIIIDAGSKTMALDQGAHGTEVVAGYGMLINNPGLTIPKLSEEHGIIQSSADRDQEPAIGDQVEIIPNHACVTVNLTEHLVMTRQGQVIDSWQVAARGR